MVVSSAGLLLTLGAMFAPNVPVNLPVFNGAEGFGLVNVPVSAALLVLVGLCTSVMWGGIFNLAVEGLGKYTEKASGIFMALVCGGGILPLLQNGIVDLTGGVGYLTSYWVIVAGLAICSTMRLSVRRTSTRIFRWTDAPVGKRKSRCRVCGAGIFLL